ncbi:MAG TPA: Gfo/Idh/MocA family oxidoreductase [Lacipirellulaceae bacterium]|nr:Gfo/Idh/MocA family oxidoreductase [Lacipirellulaceae bacterium]
MNPQSSSGKTRREFLKHTGRIAAATTIVSASAPFVHASEDNTIRLALVGCGGRGTGAANNALSVKNGPIEVVALADILPSHIAATAANLKQRGKQYQVPKEHQFVGFDAYRKAMDCLRPGDVVILATPPAFRWVHFPYAIKKGLNVFMEKPVAVDVPTSLKMFELAKESVKKNQKVGVGLMCRHCRARGELFRRIQDGEIGDLTLMRAYRIAGKTATEASPRKPDDEPSELIWQIKRFHSFLWASGGCYSDFLIHNLDECCWMKNAWPVEAHALGGRHYRGDNVDQNFDVYAVEYTFDDGAKLFLDGRTIDGCYSRHTSRAQGTKGSCIISKSGHMPALCRTFKGQKTSYNNPAMEAASTTWAYGKPEPDPYEMEWVDLIAAIREDRPYNEVERGTEASLQAVMGRMAAHTGQKITRKELLQCKHEFAPDVDKLTMDSPSPLVADADGKYPVPQPGRVIDREY